MSESLFDGFILRAVLGGGLAALLTAPLGCFVLWQRMAFFGDALAHSALLGIALGLLLGISPEWSVIGFCVIAALALAGMQANPSLAAELSPDTRLGLIAHGGLAGGLVILALSGGPRFDLHAYLFGDVLTVTAADLWRMLAVVIVVSVTVAVFWKRMLLITINEDIARVEGLPVQRLKLLFTLLLALVVANAIPIVGVLLTASLLIVPAAAARRLARTPEQMLSITVVCGLLAVIGGVAASLRWDLPAGPAIVLAALGLFVLVQVIVFRKA